MRRNWEESSVRNERTKPHSSAVSGCLLEEYLSSNETFSQEGKHTEVFMTHGSRDDRTPLQSAKKNVTSRSITQLTFQFEALRSRMSEPSKATWKEYNKGHQMFSSQEEMKDVLEFLSRRMKLRNIALEKRSDIVEVKSFERTK